MFHSAMLQLSGKHILICHAVKFARSLDPESDNSDRNVFCPYFSSCNLSRSFPAKNVLDFVVVAQNGQLFLMATFL